MSIASGTKAWTFLFLLCVFISGHFSQHYPVCSIQWNLWGGGWGWTSIFLCRCLFFFLKPSFHFCFAFNPAVHSSVRKLMLALLDLQRHLLPGGEKPSTKWVLFSQVFFFSFRSSYHSFIPIVLISSFIVLVLVQSFVWLAWVLLIASIHILFTSLFAAVFSSCAMTSCATYFCLCAFCLCWMFIYEKI